MPRRTVLISPLAIDDESDIRLVGATKGEAKRLWLDAPDFGAYLRTTREALNLSLRKAAERIGVSHTYVAQFERGETTLTLDMYRRVADAYGVDVREVLDRGGCRYALVEEVADLLQNLRQKRFRRLWLDRDLKPADFEEKHLKLFPETVQTYIIELVKRVDDNARAGRARVHDKIDGTAELDEL